MKNKMVGIFSLVFLAACGSKSDDQVSGSDLKKDSVVAVVSADSSIWQTASIDRPFQNLDVDFQSFKYSNRTGLTFELPSGTRVDIPANAFQDSAGNPVSENIEVKYREFHDIADIMLAGINMKYNEGDTIAADFETAGMFEIRAFGNNQPLELRKDKTIQVELASFKPGDFNNYQMNDATGNWEFIEKKSAAPNKRKKERLAELEKQDSVLQKECNAKPVRYTKSPDVFDLNYDFHRFADMRMFNEAQWLAVGTEDQKRTLRNSLQSYNQMLLIPTDTCNVFRLTLWNEANLVRSNVKSFHVTPVWTANAYERAEKNYELRVAELKQLAEERVRVDQEADLVRSFQLKGMGIFNCDRILDYVKFVTLSLAVVFKNKITSFFYITNNGSVAIRYYSPSVPDFRFNPNSTNSIIAILPGNQIGKITEAQFAEAYEAYLKNPAPDKTLNVEMKAEPIPVKSQSEFKNHVAKF